VSCPADINVAVKETEKLSEVFTSDLRQLYIGISVEVVW